MIEKSTITGGVLSGGESRRMERDKGLLEVSGKSFIAHVRDAMQPFVSEILISSSNTAHAPFGICITDHFPGKGPLAGVHALLEAASTTWVMTCPCDMPFVTGALFDYLLTHADPNQNGVIIEDQGRIYPLTAVFSKKCLPVIEQRLASGELKMQEVVRSLGLQPLHIRTHFGAETDQLLVNFNTPEELKKWKGQQYDH